MYNDLFLVIFLDSNQSKAQGCKNLKHLSQGNKWWGKKQTKTVSHFIGLWLSFHRNLPPIIQKIKKKDDLIEYREKKNNFQCYAIIDFSETGK
jgi:hypothetical protein